jgi:hypothetical protein
LLKTVKTSDMDLGTVAVGIGFVCWGALLLIYGRHQVTDDVRVRELAERRWWIDRRVIRGVRKGRISREQWLEMTIRHQRWFTKWIWTPFMVLFIAVGVWQVVRGLTG